MSLFPENIPDQKKSSFNFHVFVALSKEASIGMKLLDFEVNKNVFKGKIKKLHS